MSSGAKNIIWLVSYPKSGNTWIRIFLQHILEPPREENEGIPLLNDIPIASNRSLIDKYLGISSSDLTDSEISDYRPEVYIKLSQIITDPMVLKVHDSFGKTSAGKPIFPPEITKGVIYVVRNPLDVVVSYAYHTGWPIETVIEHLNDPGFTISQNRNELKPQVQQHLGSWSDHYTSWNKQQQLPIILVKYEDLLGDCRKIFKLILERLELAHTHSNFENALKKSEFNHLKTLEETYGFREKPLQAKSFFREGRHGNYKNILSREQISSITSHHQKIMLELSYI